MIMEGKNGKSNSANGGPPKKRPFMRVRNASIIASRVLAAILSSDDPVSDGRGFSFCVPGYAAAVSGYQD